MKIEKLILKEFERFRLKPIRYFEYTPGKKTQAILGSNGSGKSSLLEELSPLPGNPKNYKTNGSKEVWISHRGRTYYLASLFKEEGNLFLFEMDGTNLNGGNTVTGYRELVKEHFNYTKDIHAVLTGSLKFSSMSVNDRRNWFMPVSGLDYDYAVGFYRRTKEQIRGLQGALSRTQERLTQESLLLITPEREAELTELIAEEKKKLDLLLNHRPAFSQAVSMNEFKSTGEALESTLRAAEELIGSYEACGSRKPLKALYALKNKLLEEMAVLSQSIQVTQQNLAQLDQQLKEYSGLEGVDVQALEVEVKRLEDENQHIVQARQFFFTEDPEKSSAELEQVLLNLNHYAETIEELHSVTGDGVRLTELTNGIVSYTNVIQDAAKLLEILTLREKELSVKRDEGEIACPGCDHRWIPNYNQAEHLGLIREIERAKLKWGEHEKTLNSLSSEKEKLQRYLNLRQSCFQLMSRSPSLKPLWAKLLTVEDGQKELLFSDTSRSRFVLEQAKQELRNELKYRRATDTIEQHKKIIQIAKAAEKKDKKKLTDLMDAENLNLSKLQQRNLILSQELSQVRDEILLLEKIEDIYLTWQNKHATYLNQGKQIVLMQLNKAMQEASYHHSSVLSNYEKQRSQIELRKSIVANLEAEILGLKKEIELLQKTELALSPSVGLIAKGMSNFINSFVARVNEIVSMVWLYPLELSPIEMSDDEELDYRFVVKVKGEDATPDVASVSEGMKEIINLAFILASMHFLGLEDYPVFLDEFAVKMDVAHRDAAYAVIDYLADSQKYSQLFLISHYEAGYANLADAEFTVLCPANIAIPKSLSYNQNCVIE